MNNSSFDKAYTIISKLVEDFEANISAYKSPSYSEQSVRNDFINKFFIALGWDVNHETEKNPYEQEVKIELNVNVQGRKKRADYAFCLKPNFRDVVFYAEAKKPSVEIANADDYFQTIRYGYNSKTPIAVLTDFEQFHILDCRYSPSIETALDRSYKKFTYKDYLNKDIFSEIYFLFSREAVANGSIEKRTLELPKARGGAVQLGLFKGAYQPIDEKLLDELDEYRNSLAHAFKNGNPELDHWSLTEIVQRTIDRLVFMRFLEDKLIEPEDLISKFGSESHRIWPSFVSTCKKLDKVYNGTIYKKHDILDAPEFKFDENVFADICERLSNKNTPYDFNTIPIHILGSIYERFLGKVITTSDKRAKVEEKPEVKKAGGVFYTPEYIVRYIVKNTIGELIEDKTPTQISKMRFADMACGSGSFLLGAYDYLLSYYMRYYNNNPAQCTKDDCVERDGALFLSLHKKREILLNNIFGVDIDQQAVEVAQLSLYLKLLENETLASTSASLKAQSKETVLPSLSKNIQCGNSIIGPDFYESQQLNLFDSEYKRTMNVFDWKTGFPDIMNSGGFDAVVGNPPYVRQETLGIEFKEYAATHYKTFSGTADLYVYFFEYAHKLLKKNGLFGMICSNKFMRANYGKPLRDFLFKETGLLQIADFGELPVFENAATFPAIYLTRNEKVDNQKFTYAAIKRLDFQSLEEEVKSVGSILDHRSLLGDNWTLASSDEIDVIDKIKKAGIPLAEYEDIKIFRGVLTGLNEAFVIDDETTRMLLRDNPKSKEIIRPFVRGDDIRKYRIDYKGQFLIFIPKGWTNENNKSKKSPWAFLSSTYPAIANHLKQFEKQAETRCDKGDYWWEFRACNYYDKFEVPKIIFPDIAKESRMSFDEEGLFVGNTAYIIPTNDLYLLALLNSKLIFLYFKRNSTVLGDADKGGRLRWIYQDVVKIPIRPINFNKSSDKGIHARIVKLVSSILELNKKLPLAKGDHEKTLIERQISDADRQLNVLVYALYGLSEEEIKIVEHNN